jgi:hypothetical protein
MWVNLYPFNLLNLDGSSITTDGYDAGYPNARLGDLSVNLYWKYGSEGTVTIKVDQGASGSESIDFLAIERHNFDGETIAWQYSDNDSDWYDAVTSWSQSGNTQIIKTLSAAITHRYWRVTVTSMSSPQCTEIFMSRAYQFQVVVAEGPSGEDVAYVDWRQTYGDVEISSKRGSSRRSRIYPLFHAQSSYTLASFREAIEYLDDYSKPFYFKDHEDNYWMARMAKPSTENYLNQSSSEKEIEVIEML